ncbi:unnamed protein product [Strongylus vulgaris]|uniref:Peptidase A1 domain-containing protein n=1 Tax=Strongylus vulgaris TaxID=40348 RepID=A0A3P7M267_STRVU|nr:unnamed protein product [Strongylus vulgaris]
MEGLLEEPIFTVWLGSRAQGGASGGQITYGGLDNEHCGPIIAYEELSSATFFQFKISGIGVGKLMKKETIEVMSDTGSSFIGGPKSDIERLAKAVGAEYVEGCEIYRIPCDANPPNLNIYIGSNKYSIESANYIIDPSMHRQFSERLPLQAGDMCIFAVSPATSGWFGPAWILGTPFIRQYCNIHDMGQKRIGFARSLTE